MQAPGLVGIAAGAASPVIGRQGRLGGGAGAQWSRNADGAVTPGKRAFTVESGHRTGIGIKTWAAGDDAHCTATAPERPTTRGDT